MLTVDLMPAARIGEGRIGLTNRIKTPGATSH